MANKSIIDKKAKDVQELAARIKNAQVVLLTDYKGITVENDTKLRSTMRENKANYTVIKNNIIKRALEEAGYTEFDEKLVGPTAIITCDTDYLATTKAIYKFAKDNENYTIKGGIIENEVKSTEEINVLAQLPSREELIAKLAGVLLANISKLAVALDQVKKQKEA